MGNNRRQGNAVDYMKIIMALLVVAIHTLAPASLSLFILTQGVARVAVPFFFISSGYFFATKAEQKEFTKTLSRLLILYIAWSLIYSPYIVKSIYQSSDSIPEVVYNSAYLLFKGWRHLWFMPALILGITVYHLLRNNRFVLPLALALYICGLIVQNALAESEYSVLLYRNFLFFAFPLVTLGAMLRKTEQKKLSGVLLSAATAIAFLMLLFESAIKYHNHLYNNDILFCSPAVAALLFLLCTQINTTPRVYTRAIATSIYFIHFIFFLLLRHRIENQLCLFFIVAVCTLALSLILIRFRKYRLICT